MVEMRHKSPRWRTYAPRLLKAAVAIALVAALYRHLFVARPFDDLTTGLWARLASAPPWMPLAIAALVPVNLGLEAAKFAALLPQARRPGLAESLARVCAGLTVGVFTPNRVGEYLGRLARAHPGERGATVVATLLGGAAQWVPLLWGGAVAALAWPLFAGATSPLPGWHLAAALAVGALLIGGFLRLGGAVAWAARGSVRLGALLPGRRAAAALASLRARLLPLARAASSRPRRLRAALAISWLRYGIYVTQLALAFAYCGLEASPAVAAAGTAAILLAQALLPVPAVVQALARIELARLLWGGYAPNEVGLATASLLVFVLNLGLPALVGLGVILRSDVARTLGPRSVREPQRPGAGPRAGLVREPRRP